jgi:hypothetical protein
MTAGRQSITDKKDWGTPKKYVDAVKEVFGGIINLDPCSSPYSIVEAEVEFMLPLRDGLQQKWDYRTIFVNPPYGNDTQRGTKIVDWLRKCAEANRVYDSEVIALVPVATNTRHWKEYVYGKATALCFLYDTRLKFLINGIDKGKGAPMSCAMLYWGSDFERFYNVFIRYGAVLDLRPLSGVAIGSANSNGKEKEQRQNTIQDFLQQRW